MGGLGRGKENRLSPRQQHILDQLIQHDPLEVEQLAADLDVTPQTIRRDLAILCDRGLARRRYGGITRPAGGYNLALHQRESLAFAAKRDMAAKAIEDIPDGASLSLGIGTSVIAVAEALFARQRLRVITNNLQAAQTLIRHPSIEIYLAEGRLRDRDLDVVGSSTVAFFARHRVDVTVLGCGGLDVDGLLDFNPEEAAVSQALLTHAKHRILVADKSKWGRAAMCRVAPLDAIDTLVTDGLPRHQEAHSALEAMSLRIKLTQPTTD